MPSVRGNLLAITGVKTYVMKQVSLRILVALCTFSIGVATTMVRLATYPVESHLAPRALSAQANEEGNQRKIEEADDASSGCLNSPKPELKTVVVCGTNSKVIDLPQPSYPEAAKAAKIEGLVIVTVVVDESGEVIWARANSGHPLLQAAVMKVVCRARFTPALLPGRPVKVWGVIRYQFVLGSV